MKLKYSLIANGEELLRREFQDTPITGDWRLFVETQKPKEDKHQSVFETTPTVTSTHVTQRWATIDITPLDPARSDPVIGVPQEIPLFAFRIALDELGLLDSVLAFIEKIEDPKAKRAALTHLEYGNFITRSHPLLVAFSEQYGIKPAQVDDIFRVAEELRDGVADFGEVAIGHTKSYERTLWERVKSFTKDLLKP